MKIEFGLLDNALDSIQRAIDQIAYQPDNDEASKFKQAIQNIAHGIELLLKERLRRIHPALLWENVDKYPSLVARTVTAEGALDRLRNIGNIHFDKSDIELIKRLRATRNAIEHYVWSTTKTEAERIVVTSFAFAVVFSKRELGYEFFGYHTRKDHTLEDLIAALPSIEVALRNRSTSVERDLMLRECSHCRALAVDAATAICTLCGHRHWFAYEGSFIDYFEPPF